MTKNFLEIDNVTFTASAQNKVSNVSLSIENQGDIICLLGPSGIGKTTILRTIAGLVKINSGKIVLKNNTLIKTEPKPYIDFNAIAKGYTVDLVAAFLESKNTTDYLVNIGGELRAKGINIEKQSGWTVGIENPNFDGSQSYDKVIVLKDKAMATTGTYRKFKLDDNGSRYAHIIDTKTGYPTKTNILSVSVIADNCMLADGYATAFQAMGVENVQQFLTEHSELQAYLIFENENQEFEMLSLNNFPVK